MSALGHKRTLAHVRIMSALPPKADIVIRRLHARLHRVCRSELVSMFVKAEGPSGRAKIHSDDPKHALGLAQYLRAIGYSAWIEDTNGNEVDETALKMAIRSPHDARSS